MRERITNQVIDKRLVKNQRPIIRIGQATSATGRIVWKCINCSGEWIATPDNIFSRNTGCTHCSKKRKLTNENVDSQLIGRSINRLENVINNKTKIMWQCTACNDEWSAAPCKILVQKTGCKKCNNVIRTTNRRLTLEKFTSKSVAVHGLRYDYSKVTYTNFNTKVIILCNIHGAFSQTPGSHLNGNGCPKCAIKLRSDSNDEFITKAKHIHGELYDYSKVQYINSHDKITIICQIHGEFLQKPNTHLDKKAGCLRCDRENRKGSYSYDYFEAHPEVKTQMGWLYIIKLQNFIKIGITKNIKQRTKSYYGMNKEIISSTQMTLFEAYNREQSILISLKQHKYFPQEKFDGYTECLKDTPIVRQLISELLG